MFHTDTSPLDLENPCTACRRVAWEEEDARVQREIDALAEFGGQGIGLTARLSALTAHVPDKNAPHTCSPPVSTLVDSRCPECHAGLRWESDFGASGEIAAVATCSCGWWAESMPHTNAPTQEETPPLSLYDELMAEEAGLEPPTDTPIEDNPRAEECVEYYRSVS